MSKEPTKLKDLIASLPLEEQEAIHRGTEVLLAEERARIKSRRALANKNQSRIDPSKALEILWAAGDEPPREGDEVKRSEPLSNDV